LTDAGIILTALSRKRNHIKITCKDTLFKMNFVYWALNTMLDSVPIMRRREYGDKMDNCEAFANLIKALESGDAVLLFPEGYSRYNSTAGNFLMGVSNISSEILTDNIDNPDFKLNILPLSINYGHREKFRSNMIITCHRPIVLNPVDHKDLIIDKNNIKDNQRQAPFKPAKSLTLAMDKIIRNGILDSPNWEYIEYAQTARNLYHSYGLDITYGNYIRLTRRFLDVFARKERKIEEEKRLNNEKEKDLNVNRFIFPDEGKDDKITKLGPLDIEAIEKSIDIDQLAKDLILYQDFLDIAKIPDKIFISDKSLINSLMEIVVEGFLSLIQIILLIPYFIIWTPILVFGKKYERKAMKSGDLEDNFDEIAQKKGLSGVVIILCLYLVVATLSLFTLNIFYILCTIISFPFLMIFGVIILENYSRSQRNFMYNIRYIRLKYFQKDKYLEYVKIRKELYERVQKLSKAMNLPSDPNALKSNKNVLYSEDRSLLFKIYVNLLRKEDWNDTLRTRDIIRYSKDKKD
jgi:glycerol-3-phosphate O-acyltransferase/dihydroxyacetone phosphate acyltransferase